MARTSSAPRPAPGAASIEKRIRWAGALIALGIATQLASLFWTHPLSFMAFLVFGCPLTLAGVLLYLYSLSTRT